MIRTITSTAAFSDQVLASHAPVLVDFYADWCGPCQAQTPVLEAFAATHSNDVEVVKVNIDEHPQLASTYGVRSIPTLKLFENGEVTDTRVGVSSATQLEALLNTN